MGSWCPKAASDEQEWFAWIGFEVSLWEGSGVHDSRKGENKRLKTIFDAIDVDGSGTLDIDEFTSAYKMYDSCLTDGDIHALFKNIDTDGSGYIGEWILNDDVLCHLLTMNSQKWICIRLQGIRHVRDSAEIAGK